MKRFLTLAALFACLSTSTVLAQTQYKVITIVESIIPSGIGRSRMVENGTDLNVEDFTTDRTNGTKSNQGSVSRRDLKVDEFSETKMLNFFSAVGINFQNIASNDAIIESKLNQMSAEGWTLMTVTSGVESDAGKDDGQGIFITRMFFKK